MSTITINDPKVNEPIELSLDSALSKLNQAMLKRQAKVALAYATQIIEQKPNCKQAYSALYQILSFQQNFPELERVAIQAISHNEDDAHSYQALSNAYRFQRKSDEALHAMKKAVELAPNNTPWLNDLGIMYKELGQFEIALKTFELCVLQSPDFTESYWHRSDINAEMPKHYIKHLVLLLADKDSLNKSMQVYAAYALFKHYEYIKNFEKAFEYLTLGAETQRNTFNYDHQLELQEHENIEQVFDAQFFKQCSAEGKKLNTDIPTDSPIFICGLPRSGTTLTEQIISSHKDVAAGDELFELARATQQVLQQIKPKQAFPFLARELTKEHWQNIGEKYLSLTQHININRFFTDKMPLNYKAIGLIHMALPSAKIVYCQRPPMDLLLGAYKQVLSQGNKYTYDLDELTSMIIAHHKLMQHWLNVFPDKIFTLNYQDLIHNQKDTTKKLLQFLGLNWQESCLHFYENNRVIHTLSNTQVRQPLFSKSLNSWHKYKAQLSPYAKKMQEAGLKI